MLAAVHVPERQPGEAEQGKCDRDADLVQDADLSVRSGLRRFVRGRSPGPLIYPSNAPQIP
jgi:hypothetical protein